MFYFLKYLKNIVYNPIKGSWISFFLVLQVIAALGQYQT
jgi:hypothetical protein